MNKERVKIPMNELRFDTIEDAIKDIQEGKCIILVDDEDRENEGDFCCAAEKVTPEIINYMAKFGRGLICLTLEEEQVDQLQLGMMTTTNRSVFETNFTVSIEAASGVTTGISAHDRAHTIKTAVNPHVTAKEIVTPGHMFPIKGRKGGTLNRAGQTEGSIDLARLAGLHPSGVICEIMNEDGTMARYPDLRKFADEHQILIVTIQDLISYRIQKERQIQQIEQTQIKTKFGEFDLFIYNNLVHSESYLAFTLGNWSQNDLVPVRVHVQEVFNDLFGSMIDNNEHKISKSFQIIQKAGKGLFLYIIKNNNAEKIIQEVSSIIPKNDTAGAVSENNKDNTIREYGFGAQIMLDLGINKLQLITNSEHKVVGLGGFGLEIIETISF